MQKNGKIIPMAYIADLHIHSRFSRACSQALNVPNLVEWAKLKGINLLGTGDFLHPLWLAELKNQLHEDGSGFLSYGTSEVKFILTVEVASIYNHKGATRRIHNLIFLPSFESASKLQQILLAKKATLASDGRPIVGISSKELLKIALDASEKAIFIPAHVWTPWFGIFGSESGYDSLADCFEEMIDFIYAVETGLSSDPAMNWRIAELDQRSIISSSDAHSLPNLARETTVFDKELGDGYEGLLDDLKNQKIVGTIEFYPEEGKYHYTGHRSCNVRYSPDDTKIKGTICPKCGRRLTVGVMERVEAIASRSAKDLNLINKDGKVESGFFSNRAGYKMLVPLIQIIAEALSSTPTSQKVLTEYKKLSQHFGGEIKVLTRANLTEAEKIAGPKIAEGIRKVREGDLAIEPGYDGVYGVVKIWNADVDTQNNQSNPQLGLFD